MYSHRSIHTNYLDANDLIARNIPLRGIWNEDQIRRRLLKKNKFEENNCLGENNEWSQTTFLTESLEPELVLKTKERIKALSAKINDLT